MSESVIMFTALQAHIEAGTIVPRLVRVSAKLLCLSYSIESALEPTC